MLPLIDSAGYKLFDTKMLSLTDGARNKLFGMKMLPHLPCEGGAFYQRRIMIIAEGYFYHIKDIYYSTVNDSSLMSNYEGGGYRPHYFAVRDSSNYDVFWMIPVSSQYAKYKALYDKMVQKYHRCTKIVLGKCGGKDAAYLIQNAFPITSDYIDHIHTLQGNPLTLHASTARSIIECLNNNLRLHKRGVRLFFADIDRLLQLMTEHLDEEVPSSDAENASPSNEENIFRKARVTCQEHLQNEDALEDMVEKARAECRDSDH